MVEAYRTQELSYKEVYNNIVNGTAKYMVDNGIKCMVLGISGGIDSTVCAAICHAVYKKTGIPLIGVSMPCTTNKEDEVSAASQVGKEFCNEFKEVNLQSAFEVMEHFCKESSGLDSTPISQGNIKARLRMITLYDIASKMGGIVIDTDNLTEAYQGFFTVHGDTCDFNPIGGLWKHEVYELANYINVWETENYPSKALEASIALMPTDGNGVKDGGDLAQIAPGKTYNDVDEILHAWVGLDSRIKEDVIKSDFECGMFKHLSNKHGKDIVKGVIMCSIKSEFKRRQLPIVVDIFRGNLMEKNGKLI